MVVVMIMDDRLVMPMQVPMPPPVMLVAVRMPPVTAHLEAERETQPHQHQPNGKFNRLRHRRRNRHSEPDEDKSSSDHRQAVAHSPREADEPALFQTGIPGQDGRHRGEVVGVQCVACAYKNAKREEGERVEVGHG